jgi:hypothetical protein
VIDLLVIDLSTTGELPVWDACSGLRLHLSSLAESLAPIGY